MRIEQLECVAAVIRLGSMRRASEELHMSQPALSQTISNLEKELGVTLLERNRAGSRISPRGRELLPWITEAIDAVDRMRSAADEGHSPYRVLRIGTVSTATAPFVTSAMREFRRVSPQTSVELVVTQQDDIRDRVDGGSIDLGLVNLLDGDDVPPELASSELLRAPAVVCCRSDDPLAAAGSVSTDALLARPFVAMRSGYVMHRYVHRVLGMRRPGFAYTADGAEMGKLLVAEGLGVTLLPRFSVDGDPLERTGVITSRPLATPGPDVVLSAWHLPMRQLPATVRRFAEILAATATTHRSVRVAAG